MTFFFNQAKIENDLIRLGFYGSSLQKSVYWFALFSDRSEDSRIADDHLRQAMVFLFEHFGKMLVH